MKFTLHSPRAEAKKKSRNRQDMLPEFSASLLPLLTQPIWGASSTRTETFSIEPRNADVTTRYAPKCQQAPVPDQTSEGSPGWFGKNPTEARGNISKSPSQRTWKASLALCPSRPPPAPAQLQSDGAHPVLLGARSLFPHRRLENPQPSSPTALSAARRCPYPGARAGSPPPRARQSGCVQGAE